MNKQEELIIKNIGLLNYSQQVMHQCLGEGYTALDTKVEKHKRRVLVSCPHGHDPYWTELGVIKKGHGCRKCYEDPSILDSKKLTELQQICQNSGYRFLQIVRKGSHGKKSLVLKVEDEDGLWFDVTLDEIRYRGFAGMCRFTNTLYGTHNIIAWLQKYRPDYEFCSSNWVNDNTVYQWKYIGPDKVCNPYFEAKGRAMIYDWRRHPDLIHTKSKGHIAVRNFLNQNNINFVEEKTFDDLRSTSQCHMFFDFYLSNFNIAIEVDGPQHSEPIECFGGFEGFVSTQQRDLLKNQYCLEHNIKLVRIPYEHIIQRGSRGINTTFQQDILSAIHLIIENSKTYRREQTT